MSGLVSKDDVGRRLEGTKCCSGGTVRHRSQNKGARSPALQRRTLSAVATPPFPCCSPALPISKQFSVITSSTWNVGFIFLVSHQHHPTPCQVWRFTGRVHRTQPIQSTLCVCGSHIQGFKQLEIKNLQENNSRMSIPT